MTAHSRRTASGSPASGSPAPDRRAPEPPAAGSAAGSRASDPLAALGLLPRVPEAVDSVRTAVDQVYGHRVMRRRAPEVAAEVALRAARSSAALAGADWALEEVRRRTDFSADDASRTVGAALRVTAEAGRLLAVWRRSPVQALARLHLVAAGGAAPDDTVGRPRRAGEQIDIPDLPGLADLSDTADGAAGEHRASASLPDADEVAARLGGLADLLISGTGAPTPVVAAVVHGELLALRPFRSYNGLVARAAERIVLVGGGLDPKSVCPAEVGHAELGRSDYVAAWEGYMSGTAEGMARWIGHCARAIGLGARESTAVCEALQRGAAR